MVISNNTALLFERLRALGADIPTDARLRQTYVTRNSRRAGAWAWYLTDASGKDLKIGSQHTSSELLQSALILQRSEATGTINVKIDFESRPLGRIDPRKHAIGQ